MSKVIVAGSINMDVVAIAERHPQKGETVPGSNLQFIPGGKGANQAVAARKLEAKTQLVGKVGTDGFGSELTMFLKGVKLDLEYLGTTNRAATGTALIVVADSDNTIVVVPGANGLLSKTDIAKNPITTGDVLVSQFETPLETVQAFFARGRRNGAVTILNPAPARPCSKTLLKLVDVLVVNETELAVLAKDMSLMTAARETVLAAARKLRVRTGQRIIVTLGSKGYVAIDGDETFTGSGIKKVVDTTGAGDCFVGALAARLAGKDTFEEALTYANKAAKISTQRFGAGPSMPNAREVSK